MSFNNLARTEEKGKGGGFKNGSPKKVGKYRMVSEKSFSVFTATFSNLSTRQ